MRAGILSDIRTGGDTVRNLLPILAVAATVISGSPVLAASGAEYEGAGLLMIMFLGFGAMILAFQAVLVAMLLFPMVKAMITRPLKGIPTLAMEQNEHDS